MAGNTRLGVVARNASIDGRTALLAAGKIRLYDGTQPAADGALSGNTLLWEGTFATPARGAASSGSAALTGSVAASVTTTGTPTWEREVKADGTTIVQDGNVSVNNVGGANLNIVAASLVAGATLTVTADADAQPAQGT